jgi:hypothetical protein
MEQARAQRAQDEDKNCPVIAREWPLKNADSRRELVLGRYRIPGFRAHRPSLNALVLTKPPPPFAYLEVGLVDCWERFGKNPKSQNTR